MTPPGFVRLSFYIYIYIYKTKKNGLINSTVFIMKYFVRFTYLLSISELFF